MATSDKEGREMTDQYKHWCPLCQREFTSEEMHGNGLCFECGLVWANEQAEAQKDVDLRLVANGSGLVENEK